MFKKDVLLKALENFSEAEFPEFRGVPNRSVEMANKIMIEGLKVDGQTIRFRPLDEKPTRQEMKEKDAIEYGLPFGKGNDPRAMLIIMREGDSFCAFIDQYRL